MEAVEERAHVELRRLLVLAGRNRALEIEYICAHDGFIQAKSCAPFDGIGVAGALECVDGLREGVAGAVFVGIRPEKADGFFAGGASRAGGGDEGEQGEGASLQIERGAVSALERARTERAKVKHRVGGC
ncbi:MAG TPA: hypothetical protein VFW04_15550 [Gemmatimonadaceae bacterium]|nr:hypothetical protein [Gemmatimonadaceae bacterium]